MTPRLPLTPRLLPALLDTSLPAAAEVMRAHEKLVPGLVLEVRHREVHGDAPCALRRRGNGRRSRLPRGSERVILGGHC